MRVLQSFLKIIELACSRTVRELIRDLTYCANNCVVRGELASRTVRELFALVRKLIREEISETQTPAVLGWPAL